MPTLFAETLPRLPGREPSTPSRRSKQPGYESAPVAVRGPVAKDIPDRSYWTAYDHFMVEREARAMRRAYFWALVARAWPTFRRR